MSKRANRVKDLAAEAGRDLDDALVLLWDVDVQVSDANSIIAARDLRSARSVLGLQDESKHGTVDYWVERSGLTRYELTKRLYEEGVVLSPNVRRIPKNSLRIFKTLFPESEVSFATPTESKLDRQLGPLKWEIVGTGAVRSYLDEDELASIHEVLVEDFRDSGDPIEPPGIREMSLLSSAAMRPMTSLGPTLKYPTPEMAGAALFHSLVHNHPFHNGNKRTGLVALLVFLSKNGLVMTCDQDELFRKTLILAGHNLIPEGADQLADREVMDLSRWIRSNSRRLTSGERLMKWHKIKARLRDFDCDITLASGVGNRINIKRQVERTGTLGLRRRRTLQVQVAFAGDGTEADRNTIHLIRKELELDEAHGVDSATFYDGLEVDGFISEYRRLLQRLARL